MNLCAARSEPCDPHLPPVKCKIENADKHAGNRQNGYRDVGIDKLVEVMEQKASLVRLDPCLGFEPVLKQSQRTRPQKQFRKDSPDERSDMQLAKNRA